MMEFNAEIPCDHELISNSSLTEVDAIHIDRLKSVEDAHFQKPPIYRKTTCTLSSFPYFIRRGLRKAFSGLTRRLKKNVFKISRQS